ncbi:hypothetical protein HCN44_010081 [Aphidius gifuensis]|uniref:Uncharacterized protein n=1 Tax=Aphidius gifuensis TaxID=684658 RepID=A0A834XWQ6_APHGI|nr:hypothetical protein HCN44_010081 [Aphidius gifuensis]
MANKETNDDTTMSDELKEIKKELNLAQLDADLEKKNKRKREQKELDEVNEKIKKTKKALNDDDDNKKKINCKICGKWNHLTANCWKKNNRPEMVVATSYDEHFIDKLVNDRRLHGLISEIKKQSFVNKRHY